MSFDKYYDLLFIDGKLNREYVTYLSTRHLNNALSKKDSVTNEETYDLGVNYSSRFDSIYQTLNTPLCFLYDDIYDIYKYTKPHIDNILKAPKQSIIKETKLITKERLKTIEPKTMIWLSNKTGSTVREKLALVNKVSSTVKKYSYNILENQLLLSFYKSLYKLLIKKMDFMINNPSVFGNIETSNEINKLKVDLNKLGYAFKNIFNDVVRKEHSRPNNTLLGNVDYRSIWKSYLDIKRQNIDYSNAFIEYKKSLYNCIIYSLLNKYNFIEQPSLLENAYDYVLYRIDGNILFNIIFKIDNNFSICLLKRNIINGKLAINEESVYRINIDQIDDKFDRGLSFEMSVNNKSIGNFCADLLGTREAIDSLLHYLGLEKNCKTVNTILDNRILMVSINSFDNCSYGDNISIAHIVKDTIIHSASEIYYADGNNIYLNNIENKDYFSLLKYVSTINRKDNNSVIVYDINDAFDEFSSAELRRNFTSAFLKSYPVWRSVVTGESLNDEEKEKVKYIIDLCGKEFSISKLGRKNMKFVHYGPIEVPLYYQKYNELDFYNEYLEMYQDKYETKLPVYVINDIIYSGSLANVFTIQKERYISCIKRDNELNFYCVKFDNELFKKLEVKFISYMSHLLDKYKDECYCIVPNFINTKGLKAINNIELVKGSCIISDRVDKHEIAWYEVLPDLSLEIIKDGMYDELVLVKDLECENIIGKKFNINPIDKFTLTKGEKHYILPLNKSFVGEQNKFYVAKVQDRSFPLAEDVDVKLRIEYSFESENSYLLFFEPVDSKDTSFSKIEVIWEKEETNETLISPKIGEHKYSNNFESELSHFQDLCMRIQRDSNLLRNRKFKGSNKPIYDNVRKIANLHQVLIKTNEERVDYEVRNTITLTNIIENLKYLRSHEIYQLEKETNEKYKVIHCFNIEEIEIALVEINFNDEWFTEGRLMFPESCYGRFLARHPHSKSVIDSAFNKLIELSEQDSYLSSKQLRMHFQSLTSMTIFNPHIMCELSKANSSYPLYLLSIVTKLMKEMSEFNYDVVQLEKIVNSPKENAFLMRFCVEIIISFLLARDLLQFRELKPGHKYAKELIRYIKVFNKKYMNVVNWGLKKPNMISQYRLDCSDKPENLYNVWNEAYCLILYLSGDERANYVTIGGDKDAVASNQ